MRVISMQNLIVWDILKRDGVYTADLGLCREKTNYKEDIEQLGGFVPIWCWAYPDLGFVMLYNNEIFEYLRCEMSLGQDNCWDHFLLLEVEIPENKLLTGKHHNGCCWSKVFDKLTYNMIKSVYRVSDASVNGWYFKNFTPIYRLRDSVLPADGLDCKYWEEHEDSTPEFIFDKSCEGRCLACNTSTDYTYRGKHFCSLKCAFSFENRLIQTSSMKGVNPYKVIALYNHYGNSELQGKITDIVDRLAKVCN